MRIVEDLGVRRGTVWLVVDSLQGRDSLLCGRLPVIVGSASL